MSDVEKNSGTHKPEFAGKWVRLGDVVEASKERNRGMTCRHVYSVTNSRGFTPSTEYFSKEVFSEDLEAYRVVRRRMIAYNPSRINVGSVALQDELPEVVVSPLYVVFSVDESRLLPEYLLAFLKSRPGLAQISFRSTGTVRNNLRFETLCQLEMKLPCIELQRERVGLLAALSKQTEDLKKLRASLDDLVKSQSVEMFGEVADVCRLQDIAETYSGDRGKNYPTADDKVSTGYPFINAGNLRGGKVSFEEMDFITAEKYQSLSGGKICKGDILYCLRGSLGKSALSDFDEGTVASSLMIIRANPNKVIPRYLFEALNAPDVERQMRAADNGSSQPNLSAKSVRSYSIPLPPLSQQQTFADFVAKVDKLGFDCYREIVCCSVLFSSMSASLLCT